MNAAGWSTGLEATSGGTAIVSHARPRTPAGSSPPDFVTRHCLLRQTCAPAPAAPFAAAPRRSCRTQPRRRRYARCRHASRQYSRGRPPGHKPRAQRHRDPRPRHRPHPALRSQRGIRGWPVMPPSPGSPGARACHDAQRARPRRRPPPPALQPPGRGTPGARGPPPPDPRPCRYDRRYDTGMVTIACAWCGIAFAPSGRRKFHSDACRQASYRARSRAAPPRAPDDVPAMAAPPAIVYECSSCQARYLGIRRCPDCNLFCRRIGPGGPCPHCDEPVARDDLRS